MASRRHPSKPAAAGPPAAPRAQTRADHGSDGDWHLYVVRTRDDTLYTGIARDVPRRFAEHVASGPRAARYLRSKGPLTLVYVARLGDKGLALRAERAFKRLRRPHKQRVLCAQPPRDALLAMLGLA